VVLHCYLQGRTSHLPVSRDCGQQLASYRSLLPSPPPCLVCAIAAAKVAPVCFLQLLDDTFALTDPLLTALVLPLLLIYCRILSHIDATLNRPHFLVFAAPAPAACETFSTGPESCVSPIPKTPLRRKLHAAKVVSRASLMTCFIKVNLYLGNKVRA
jgi:hypothetical protein